MLKKALLPFAAAVLLGTIAVAPSARPVARESFLPPNNMKIPIRALGDNQGITRAQYDAVMDRVQALYAPIVAARGGHLTINRLWEDETVNASAEQDGANWIINMYGGLARHPAITQDGMALVACHELGHHLGGAPKYGGMDWASNEGEADYYANAKCLHRIFHDSGSGIFTRMAADEQVARASCNAAYRGAADRAVCVRGAAAGMSVTQLFRALRSQDEQPHYDTPDPSVVTEMYDGHPDTQCRLDTYYQGSLCTVAYTRDVSQTNPAIGACTRSQGHRVGLRPRCWYLPRPNELMSSEDVAAASATTSHEVKSASLNALRSESVWQGL